MCLSINCKTTNLLKTKSKYSNAKQFLLMNTIFVFSICDCIKNIDVDLKFSRYRVVDSKKLVLE